MAGWDDAVADASFAMNMDLDEPRDRRRDAVGSAAAAVGGPLQPDPDRPARSATPAELTWWLRGDRGWLRLQVKVTPEASPRIQWLAVEAVLDPSQRLLAIAGQVLAAASASGALPPAVVVSDALDTARFARSAAAAGARFGALQLGRPVAGDGAMRAVWQLATERGGAAELRLTLDAETHALTEAALLAAERSISGEAW